MDKHLYTRFWDGKLWHSEYCWCKYTSDEEFRAALESEEYHDYVWHKGNPNEEAMNEEAPVV